MCFRYFIHDCIRLPMDLATKVYSSERRANASVTSQPSATPDLHVDDGGVGVPGYDIPAWLDLHEP
jgi:hypothetical protein